jgi:tetratricopeptide (TPR) repeat protein
MLALLAGLLVGGVFFSIYKDRQVSPSPSGEQTPATSTEQLSPEEIVEGFNIQKLIAEARTFKTAGNYDAAIAKLNAAIEIFPGNVVAHNNLADIYMNFKKDYAKAELNYKKVIESDPKQLDAYRNLLELYTLTPYRPTPNAHVDIVARALKSIPGAYDLQLMLARYYRDTGNIAAAKVQYQAAIDNAKGQNLLSVAADMQAELNKLPQ